MQTFRVTVDVDGRVTIPDTRPGETITIQVSPPSEPTGPIPEAERAAIVARVKRRAEKMRAQLPEPWLSADHGDLLYGDDGLPR